MLSKECKLKLLELLDKEISEKKSWIRMHFEEIYFGDPKTSENKSRINTLETEICELEIFVIQIKILK